jgi:molybdopterin converting factor small subunit
MKIKVLFFGVLTDVVKSKERILENFDNTKSLKEHLKSTYPELAQYDHVIAVNQEVIKEDIALHDGDEVAILPPYAGG